MYSIYLCFFLLTTTFGQITNQDGQSVTNNALDTVESLAQIVRLEPSPLIAPSSSYSAPPTPDPTSSPYPTQTPTSPTPSSIPECGDPYISCGTSRVYTPIGGDWIKDREKQCGDKQKIICDDPCTLFGGNLPPVQPPPFGRQVCIGDILSGSIGPDPAGSSRRKRSFNCRITSNQEDIDDALEGAECRFV